MLSAGSRAGISTPRFLSGWRSRGDFPSAHVVPYVVAQLAGAILAAAALYLIATGKPGFEIGGFAANGYGDHSPGGYSMMSAFLIETILTAFFVIIILGATHPRAPAGFAGIAIGLALTLIHLIAIPVTNTSVNPARSTSQALFAGGWALGQLWLFWLAPLLGAVIGGMIWRMLAHDGHVATGQPAA